MVVGDRRASPGCYVNEQQVSDREKVILSPEMTVKTLDVIDSAIDPEEFFVKYVQTRTPVVIKGLIRDEGFRAPRWVSASPYVSWLSEAHPDVWKRQTWNTSPKKPAT